MTSSSRRLYNRTVLLWTCAQSDNIYCKAAWLSELKDPPDCECAVIGRLLGLGTSDNNDNNDDNNNDDNNICKNNNINNNNNKLPQIGAYFSGTRCSLAICSLARGSKKAPPTSFSPVTSTNVGFGPQNFLTFSFNLFATLVQVCT